MPDAVVIAVRGNVIYTGKGRISNEMPRKVIEKLTCAEHSPASKKDNLIPKLRQVSENCLGNY